MHAVRPASTRVTAAIAALALGAVLTACGSDEPEATEDPTTAGSPSTPSEATDSPTEEPSPVDGGAQVDIAQFVDRLQAGIKKTKQAHLEFTMSGAGGEMAGSGDVSYVSEPPDMRMTMEIGSESVAMLLVGGMMYVQNSQAGEKYVAFDLSDPNNPMGSGFAEQLDPAASMESFTTSLSSVVSAGSEDVDGRALDRYELTVDTTKLPQEQSGGGQLPADMAVTVWLDDQDRMAKTTMDMGSIVYDATMTDFDKAVDLEAPPDDQIQKAPAS